MRALAIALLVAAALPAASAQSFSDTFRCVIKDVHSLDTKGRLKRNSGTASALSKKMFSVDRASGKIDADFYTNQSPVVLWNPAEKDDTRTAYIVEDVAVMANTAKYSIFQVQEHVGKGNKPFIWHLSDAIIVGVCK